MHHNAIDQDNVAQNFSLVEQEFDCTIRSHVAVLSVKSLEEFHYSVESVDICENYLSHVVANDLQAVDEVDIVM